jgi:high-affinity K+ transport system ATPase subunit B
MQLHLTINYRHYKNYIKKKINKTEGLSKNTNILPKSIKIDIFNDPSTSFIEKMLQIFDRSITTIT